MANGVFSHGVIEALKASRRPLKLLVHQDYGSFELEKTLDEIYSLHKTALQFVDSLPEALRQRGKKPAGTHRSQPFRFEACGP